MTRDDRERLIVPIPVLQWSLLARAYTYSTMQQQLPRTLGTTS